MKIRIKNVQYYSDNETTVVCKVSIETKGLAESTCFKDLFVEAKGKSKVSKEDTFDFETGKHLAFSRAKVEAMKVIKLYLKKCKKTLDSLTENLLDAGAKVQNAIAGEEARIEKTISELG